MNNTAVRLISFDAAKYDRGVLLQWRTGYEIDNLGFNVYREINGVRTKVNASLIAGSGLQAGQGVVVTAEHSYARWDLDAAASDPTVSYWLEDVEFNGKSTLHGPMTPVAGVLQEPDHDDSDELGDIGNAAGQPADLFQLQRGSGFSPAPASGRRRLQPEVTRSMGARGAGDREDGHPEAGLVPRHPGGADRRRAWFGGRSRVSCSCS